MKVQVIRAFESHSGFVTKKEQTGSGWKFLKSRLQVCRGPSIPYLKINTYLSVPPLLRRVSQPSGQDQKNDKQTVSITILVFQDYSQGCILPYSCKLFRAISLSRTFVWIFSQIWYPTIVAKNFKIDGVQIEARPFFSRWGRKLYE